MDVNSANFFTNKEFYRIWIETSMKKDGDSVNRGDFDKSRTEFPEMSKMSTEDILRDE